MPNFTWIGKDKVVDHDKEVPFRLLKKNEKLSLGKSENLIIEGDNLEALKALLPQYYGKIKCIYIDPPYNTGKEEWVYNDNLNAPHIREWLGKVVGREGEDLTRHDKWLCMMYPRLKLLRELLSVDGVIFISINDIEQHNLRLLADEIFNNGFVAAIVRQTIKGGTGPSDSIRLTHDYVLAYAKDKNAVDLSGLTAESIELDQKDEKGPYAKGRELNKWGAGSRREDSPSMWFPIIGPKGEEVYPIRNDNSEGRWRWGKKRMLEAVGDKELIFEERKNGTYVVYEKVRSSDGRSRSYQSLFLDKYTNALGTEEIKAIFEGKSVFTYPKPTELVKTLCRIASVGEGDIVLDSFAGSGTTAHAVLDLNREDGMNRSFILVEMEKNIAKNITAKRVQRVVRGYSYKTSKGKTVKFTGLSGGFEYVQLGEALFDADGAINPKVKYEELANYLYFIETRTNLDGKKIKKPLIGTRNDTSYFLVFRGIGKNVFTKTELAEIAKTAGQKVVYADKCIIGEETLRRAGVVFKQIPYQIRKF